MRGGRQHSFGLNIKLPFEQSANPYIEGDAKLIDFKYFFTRKLFFLRESDAVALFPGGFGTQDEAFETLTLSQTGRYGPCPLVLIDEPGGDYWKTWQEQIKDNLHQRGLISPDDIHLYTITDDIEIACEVVKHFYRVYHSSRFVGQMYVMRLNYPLSDGQIDELNEEFADLMVTGKIERTKALPQEQGDKTEKLPRLIFNFDQQNYGRLYQLIGAINSMQIEESMTEHPEIK
ncbi:MAG: hypothetical protein N5P05_001693 [Chroococcopsis gigantea SAG 12.99]|nr:hypothetical protein [Chroococcopsis gigantea SAG 12.99]